MDGATLENAARLIPISGVSAVVQEAVQQLVELIEDLTLSATRQFVNAVIAEHYGGLLRKRGGWTYHHAFEGGLIVLGALMHDIGKVQTHMRGVWNLGFRHLRHEQFNVALAMPHLLELQNHWAAGAEHLSNILNWLCSTQEWRRRNNCQDAELIHQMDILDVWADRASNSPLLPAA